MMILLAFLSLIQTCELKIVTWMTSYYIIGMIHVIHHSYRVKNVKKWTVTITIKIRMNRWRYNESWIEWDEEKRKRLINERNWWNQLRYTTHNFILTQNYTDQHSLYWRVSVLFSYIILLHIQYHLITSLVTTETGVSVLESTIGQCNFLIKVLRRTPQ